MIKNLKKKPLWLRGENSDDDSTALEIRFNMNPI